MRKDRLHDRNYNLQKPSVNGSLQHARNLENRWFYLPCFLVAELFSDYLPQLESKSVGDSLRQILMGAPAKNLNIRHIFVFRGLALLTTKSVRTKSLCSVTVTIVRANEVWCVGQNADS